MLILFFFLQGRLFQAYLAEMGEARLRDPSRALRRRAERRPVNTRGAHGSLLGRPGGLNLNTVKPRAALTGATWIKGVMQSCIFDKIIVLDHGSSSMDQEAEETSRQVLPQLELKNEERRIIAQGSWPEKGGVACSSVICFFFFSCLPWMALVHL